MRYLGFGLLFFAALLVIRRRGRRGEEYLSFIEELSELFLHIEVRVGSYFEPPSVWASSFKAKSPHLASALFDIRQGRSPKDALLQALDGAKSLHGVGDTLTGAVNCLGGDELCSERDGVARARRLIDDALGDEQKRIKDSLRLGAALTLLLLLGGVIILI